MNFLRKISTIAIAAICISAITSVYNEKAIAQEQELPPSTRSCNAIGRTAVNKATLTKRAERQDLESLDPPVLIRSNSRVEDAFEYFALNSQGLPYSRENVTISAILNENDPSAVINYSPDLIGSLNFSIALGGRIIGPITYPDGVYVDVKALKERAIGFGTRNQQAVGFIFGLANSEAGRARIPTGDPTRPIVSPIPILRYLTPSDTSIGRSLRIAAFAADIELQQQFVCDNLGGDLGGRIGFNDLIMGSIITINPEIFLRPENTATESSPQGNAPSPGTLGPLYANGDGDGDGDFSCDSVSSCFD